MLLQMQLANPERLSLYEDSLDYVQLRANRSIVIYGS